MAPRWVRLIRYLEATLAVILLVVILCEGSHRMDEGAVGWNITIYPTWLKWILRVAAAALWFDALFGLYRVGSSRPARGPNHTD